MPQVDGIVSGLDTTALINATLSLDQLPKQTLQRQVSTLQARSEHLASFTGRLEAVKASLDALSDSSSGAKVSVSGSPQVAATSTTGALQGSWDVQVVKLARGTTLVSVGGFDSRTAPGAVGIGSMNISVGGVITSVSVGAGDTSLDAFAARISSVTGAKASIIDTGAATGRYRLSIQGQDTGVDHAVSIDTSGLASGAIPMNEVSVASNAEITIAGMTVTSSTNRIEGAIPGVQLDLLSVGTTTSSVDIAPDDTAMSDKVKAFVDTFNTAVGYWKANSKSDAATGVRGALSGEATSRNAIDDLGRLAVSAGATLTGITSLADVGVSTLRDGGITFDKAKFADALLRDRAGVERLFSDSSSPVLALRDRIGNVYVDATEGSLKNAGSAIDASIREAQKQMDTLDERLAARATTLRARFTRMESSLGQMRSTQSYLTSLFGSSSSGGTK